MMPWTLNYDFLKAPENDGNKTDRAALSEFLLITGFVLTNFFTYKQWLKPGRRLVLELRYLILQNPSS